MLSTRAPARLITSTARRRQAARWATWSLIRQVPSAGTGSSATRPYSSASCACASFWCCSRASFVVVIVELILLEQAEGQRQADKHQYGAAQLLGPLLDPLPQALTELQPEQ